MSNVGHPDRKSVDEVFAEPGPSIVRKQQGGELHPWQAIIGGATGNFGSGRRCRLQRRDDEAVFVKPDLGQLALSRADRYLFDGRVEPGAPFLNMALEIRFDGERQWSLLAKRRLGGRWDEVAVDRTSVVEGKGVSVRVDLGGCRKLKKQKE